MSRRKGWRIRLKAGRRRGNASAKKFGRDKKTGRPISRAA